MHALRTTAVRLLALPAVAAVTAAGIWVTGGRITDDFAVSMWLTVAWMASVAAVALGVAARSSALRWPVLLGYAAAALAAAVYLGPSVLFDDVVDERVVTVVRPGDVLERAGRFAAVRHGAAGDARVVRLAGGRRVLTLTGFTVANGPDLRVYLVAGPARTERQVDDVVDLGALKGNKGDQQYRVPARVDLDTHSTVVIWCRAFSVLFARAPLR